MTKRHTTTKSGFLVHHFRLSIPQSLQNDRKRFQGKGIEVGLRASDPAVEYLIHNYFGFELDSFATP